MGAHTCTLVVSRWNLQCYQVAYSLKITEAIGVGRIFSRGGPIVDFSRGIQNDFSKGMTKIGEI